MLTMLLVRARLLLRALLVELNITGLGDSTVVLVSTVCVLGVWNAFINAELGSSERSGRLDI